MFMATYEVNNNIIKIRCGKKPSFLRVNKTASVFNGLKVTNHCLAQFDIICKSWLITPFMSAILAAAKIRVPFSANSLIKLRSF